MDADRKRRALGLLRKQTSASMVGDALPEEKRPLLVITITGGGDATSMNDDEPTVEDEETPEDEELY